LSSTGVHGSHMYPPNKSSFPNQHLPHTGTALYTTSPHPFTHPLYSLPHPLAPWLPLTCSLCIFLCTAMRLELRLLSILVVIVEEKSGLLRCAVLRGVALVRSLVARGARVVLPIHLRELIDGDSLKESCPHKSASLSFEQADLILILISVHVMYLCSLREIASVLVCVVLCCLVWKGSEGRRLKGKVRPSVTSTMPASF